MIDFKVDDLIETISNADGMYGGDDDVYFRAGQSGLRNVVFALDIAGRSSCSSILDMGCGYGRVLRYIKARFPGASIAACDIDRDAVDFCAKTFDATAVYSDTDLGSLAIGQVFDLIWSGSLFTHLSDRDWDSLIQFLCNHLKSGGVAVFTTHGWLPVQRLRDGPITYGLGKDEIIAVLRGYQDTGFGYADYPQTPGYGVSVASPSWVMSKYQPVKELRVISFIEMGFNHHQDVFVCLRTG